MKPYEMSELDLLAIREAIEKTIQEYLQKKLNSDQDFKEILEVLDGQNH